MVVAGRTELVAVLDDVVLVDRVVVGCCDDVEV